MKKTITLLAVLIMLLVVIDEVHAEGWTDDNRHILSIEKFNIIDSEIEIAGYSFISHQDNYAYTADSSVLSTTINGTKYRLTDGNLETYVIAYTGSWDDDYMDVENCMKSGSCYVDKKADIESRDMFYSRCTDSGCGNLSKIIAYKSNNGLANDSTCNDNFKFNGKTVDGECLYYNVGFSYTLDLADVVSVLGNNDISLKVVSVNTQNKSLGMSIDKYAKASSFNIHPAVCKIKESGSCTNEPIYQGDNIVGYKVMVGNFEFVLSPFATTATYDASFSLAIKKGLNTFTSVDDTYFRENIIHNYVIQDYVLKEQLSKYTNDVYRGYYYDSLIKLDTEMVTCKSGASTCYSSYRDKNGKLKYYGNIVYPEGFGGIGAVDVDYWTRASHITFGGELKIKKFEKIEEIEEIVELTCDELFGGEEITNNDISCGNSGGYKQCLNLKNVGAIIDAEGQSSGDSSSYIYVESADQSGNCSGYKKKIQGRYYDKIAVNADVLINQEATFTFGNINPNKVYAGKGFTFEGTSYNNTVVWSNARKYSISLKPFYDYSYASYVVDNGSCKPIGNIQLDDSHDYLYYDGSDYVSGTLGDASFTVIDLAVRKKINTSNVDNIKFLSCDSNNSELCDVSNPNYAVGGVWNNTSSTEELYQYGDYDFGNMFINKYEYSLYDSYVYVTGDDAGKAKYIEDTQETVNDLIKTGKKFYVDFKWVYENVWPFDLGKNINLSFVNEMDWKLNGTCSIDVVDGYYDDATGGNDTGGGGNGDDEGGGNGDGEGNGNGGNGGNGIVPLYRYRSISLSKPFPKANVDFSNIAVNWIEWMNDTSNRMRISNTYANGIKYSIIISKFGDKLGTISISDILDYGNNNYYFSTVGLNDDGTSEFVKKFFSGEGVNNTYGYCGLGIFSSDCDRYLNN